MDGATIAAAVSGFFVVLISGGSFAYVIHRNGTEKATLSGKYEQKVTDLTERFDEFKADVKQSLSEMRQEIRDCKQAIDGGR